MDYLKNIKQTIKMPKMQKVKESGNAFFNRISLNVFGVTRNNSTATQRVTIQTSHISTISSLIDKTKIGTFSYDTKRENYGLYALKCNRTALKQGLLMNVNSELNYQIPTTTQCTAATTIPSNIDVNHEVFLPCDNNDDIENNLNSIDRYHEYYKIEFSEERGLETSTIERNTNRPNSTRHTEWNVNNKRLPPPRQKKKLLPTTTSTVNDKGALATKPISNERFLKNSQKNHLSSSCSNEQQLSGSCDRNKNNRKLSNDENELFNHTVRKGDFLKNHSGLYHIVQNEQRLSNFDMAQALSDPHTCQINSKIIAFDQYSSLDSGRSYLV